MLLLLIEHPFALQFGQCIPDKAPLKVWQSKPTFYYDHHFSNKTCNITIDI